MSIESCALVLGLEHLKLQLQFLELDTFHLLCVLEFPLLGKARRFGLPEVVQAVNSILGFLLSCHRRFGSIGLGKTEIAPGDSNRSLGLICLFRWLRGRWGRLGNV